MQSMYYLSYIISRLSILRIVFQKNYVCVCVCVCVYRVGRLMQL